MVFQVLSREDYNLFDKIPVTVYIDLLGKDFKYGGRGPDKFDCYGLAIEIYKRLGIELPEYESFADPEQIDLGMNDGRRNYLQEIPKPEVGCMVMFSIRPPYVSHMGIMLDSNKFIHIMHKSQVSVERTDSLLWANKLAGFYRYSPHE